MKDERSVSAEVEVAVDRETAFRAFTEELDLWWVRGPINFHDAARAVEMRCEAGVGGRLLEVYDDAAGDVLELGRITVWQPGERLAWRSSVDDVRVDVLFAATEGGTRVRVEARIPAGGSDRGGTAWVRVAPGWFGAWATRRPGAPRHPQDIARLALAIYYTKPVAAARWLARAFGLRPAAEIPGDESGGGSAGEPSWIEFRVGNCSLMVFRLDGERPSGLPETHVPWVFVDDVEDQLARAEGAGARIVQGMHQHGYRGFVAEDPEGHRWMIAQARPTM